MQVCQAMKGSIFWHTNPVTNQYSNKQSAYTNVSSALQKLWRVDDVHIDANEYPKNH